MFSLRSEKTVTVLLLSNNRNWKADFVNFYLVRLQNLTTDECRDTIYCTNYLPKRMILACGKRNIREPIRASFKYKDQTITFVSPSGFEERKKHNWRKFMPELGHVDAVICMMSKGFKTEYVSSVIDVLLEYVDISVLQSMYFIDSNNSIPLENLTALIGEKLNTDFGEEDQFPYKFPMFRKQLILEQPRMQLSAAFKLDIKQAVDTFQIFLDEVLDRKKTNFAINRTFKVDVGRSFKMLRELFESLCDAFVMYEKDTIGSLLNQTEKNVVVFCSCFDCEKEQQNGSNEKCEYCTGSPNPHRSDYYKKMLEYLLPEAFERSKSNETAFELRTNFRLFETLALFVAKFLMNILAVRREIVKNNIDTYVNYITVKIDSSPYKNNYKLLYQLYKREQKMYKCKNPKMALSESFYDLPLAPARFKELLQINFDAEKLAHVKQYFCAPPEVKTPPPKQPEVVKPTVDNVIGSNLINSIVDTIKEFSNEMRDLRKMCAQNELAIDAVTAKLQQQVQ